MDRVKRLIRTYVIVGIVLGAIGCAIAPTKEDTARDCFKGLRSEDPEVRKRAALELGKLRLDEAIPALASALKDPDPQVRRNAAYSLSEFEERARPAMQALKAAIEVETNSDAILNMAHALDVLQVSRKELVSFLRRVVQGTASPNELRFRYRAALFLYGSVDVAEVFPVFFEAIGTEVENSFKTRPRELISEILKKQDRRFIPPLLEALKHGNPAQRAAAAVYLTHYIPAAKEVEPALIAAMVDPYAEVRAGAANGLRILGAQQPLSKEAFQQLIKALKDPDPKVRENAAMALERGHPHLKIVIPALGEALQDPRTKVRVAAAESIRMLGPDARETIPTLIKILKEENEPELIEAVCRALSAMGPYAKEAIPLLKRALESPNPYIRNWASFALEKIDQKR
jgi:HEAT repeat protein